MDPVDNAPEGQDVSQPEGIDLDAFDAPQETAPETPAGEGDNPKWESFLKDIPTAFHDTFKAQLRSWDQGVQQRFEEKAKEWEPFKEFRDQKIDPAYLKSAYGLAQAIQQNPVEILQNLYGRLSQDPNYRQILQEKGLLFEPAAPNQPEEEVDPFTDDAVAQRFAQLEQQIKERDQQLLQFFEQQQIAEQQEVFTQQEVQRIDSDFEAIESKTGKLPDDVKAQIVQTAMTLGQQAGRYVSVTEAAPVVFRMIKSATANRRGAPSVIPTAGGNLPQPVAKDPANMTVEERAQAVIAIRDRMANQ